ncbi:hypothetical protein KIPB_007122, partial [Kipferlia bialata]|eukprot:g7122.t1
MEPELQLYHHTLQQGGGVVSSVHGNFRAPRSPDIILNKGSVLELYSVEIDATEDNPSVMSLVLSTRVFGLIRSISAFRLIGSNVDSLVIGSDSGILMVVRYSEEQRDWVEVAQATYGRTGARRTVPGQYVAVDPKGRAVSISALEKTRLVYTMTREGGGAGDEEVGGTRAKTVISSPVEAAHAGVLTFDYVGIDVGYGNPVFAALEVETKGVDKDPTGRIAAKLSKLVAFYELDLGLNHVFRKRPTAVPPSAHRLIPIPKAKSVAPGMPAGGGVLVCSEDHLMYINPTMEKQ